MIAGSLDPIVEHLNGLQQLLKRPRPFLQEIARHYNGVLGQRTPHGRYSGRLYRALVEHRPQIVEETGMGDVYLGDPSAIGWPDDPNPGQILKNFLSLYKEGRTKEREHAAEERQRYREERLHERTVKTQERIENRERKELLGYLLGQRNLNEERRARRADLLKRHPGLLSEAAPVGSRRWQEIYEPERAARAKARAERVAAEQQRVIAAAQQTLQLRRNRLTRELQGLGGERALLHRQRLEALGRQEAELSRLIEEKQTGAARKLAGEIRGGVKNMSQSVGRGRTLSMHQTYGETERGGAPSSLEARLAARGPQYSHENLRTTEDLLGLYAHGSIEHIAELHGHLEAGLRAHKAVLAHPGFKNLPAAQQQYHRQQIESFTKVSRTVEQIERQGVPREQVMALYEAWRRHATPGGLGEAHAPLALPAPGAAKRQIAPPWRPRRPKLQREAIEGQTRALEQKVSAAEAARQRELEKLIGSQRAELGREGGYAVPLEQIGNAAEVQARLKAKRRKIDEQGLRGGDY